MTIIFHFSPETWKVDILHSLFLIAHKVGKRREWVLLTSYALRRDIQFLAFGVQSTYPISVSKVAPLIPGALLLNFWWIHN